MPPDASDDQVFAYAVKANAIMISCNRNDFLELASTLAHPGLIILIRRRSALSVVTERFVEDGFLSDCAVDQDGTLGKFKRKNIRSHRTDKDLLRWLWHRPEESLAANHHDFIRVGIGRRGTHDMLKLLSGPANVTSRWPCVQPG